MRVKSILVFSAAIVTLASSGANASSRHHHHFAHRAHYTSVHHFAHLARYTSVDEFAPLAPRTSVDDFPSVARRASARASSSGRPSAWCGWEMRQLVGNDPGPQYNLARNWAHWGRPASGPTPGAIGVMPHHVFKVIQVLGRGTVLAISGNDGHAVRVRPRSTAGVIAWREG